MQAKQKAVMYVDIHIHKSPYSFEEWYSALENGMTPWGKEVWSVVKLEEGDEITVTSVKRFYYDDKVEVAWMYWAGEEPELVSDRVIWKDNGHECLVTLRLKAPSVVVEWTENIVRDEESGRTIGQQRIFAYLCCDKNTALKEVS